MLLCPIFSVKKKKKKIVGAEKWILGYAGMLRIHQLDLSATFEGADKTGQPSSSMQLVYKYALQRLLHAFHVICR